MVNGLVSSKWRPANWLNEHWFIIHQVPINLFRSGIDWAALPRLVLHACGRSCDNLAANHRPLSLANYGLQPPCWQVILFSHHYTKTALNSHFSSFKLIQSTNILSIFMIKWATNSSVNCSLKKRVYGFLVTVQHFLTVMKTHVQIVRKRLLFILGIFISHVLKTCINWSYNLKNIHC